MNEMTFISVPGGRRTLTRYLLIEERSLITVLNDDFVNRTLVSSRWRLLHIWFLSSRL